MFESFTNVQQVSLANLAKYAKSFNISLCANTLQPNHYIYCNDVFQKLRGYFENGTVDKFEGCPTGILELAIRDEVENYLSCTEDERIVKLNEDELRELILDISYKMVYKEDSLWESFHDYINWELNHYLHDKDLD